MHVRISLPAAWHFETELTVRVSDINYGGHLANDRVLTFLHEIRIQWLRSLGWTEMNLAGSGIIQTDAALQYKAQAFPGDLLRGRLAVAEVSSRGFSLLYQLERRADSREIARGSINLLFFSYADQTLAPTPASFAERFGSET